MRRMIIVIIVTFTLAITPSVGASDSTLRYYGVNTKAGDCSGITYNEVARASYPIYGGSRWTVRCMLDLRVAGTPANTNSVYGGTFDWLMASDIRVLPIIGWTNSDGSWHKPATTERQQFESFAYFAVEMLHVRAAARNFPAPNTIEVWNEPNCMNRNPPGPGSCKFGGFSSLADYKSSVYDPAFTGARNRDGDINVVVGGLGFGTVDTNGFNDASNWISAWEDRGYGLATAFSIHPYGYTSPYWPYPRMQTSNQSAANANDEFRRACDLSNRSVMATETGRRTDWPSSDSYATRMQKQYDFLRDVNNYMGWHAKGLFNYLSIDQASTGTGSAGVLDVGNNPKTAFGLWDFLGRQGQEWVLNLGDNCIP